MPSTTMSKELPEMETGKEVLVQDGEEHVNGNSMAASCKNSTKFDPTMPSTTVSKELPEMEIGKEVHVQDGEEHVNGNSMAASGEELEDGMSPAAGASYLHPLVLDESESDAEYQAWINHSSSSPEDSWLHALYFYLVGAGFDGFEVRELFRSKVLPWSKAFKHPAAALAEPEKEFEETHLQSMGDMQMPSRVKNQDDDSNGEQLRQQMNMSVRDMIGGRVHLHSKAFKRPAAAVTEPEKEIEEMHSQSMGDMQMPSNSMAGNQDDVSNGEQLQQQMPENLTVRNMINSRLHPRSKAFKRPAAALAEPKKEVHQQSMGDVQIPSRVENQGDGSNGEQLQQQIPQQMPEITVPKRRHKKTVANADPSQSQGLNQTNHPSSACAHCSSKKKSSEEEQRVFEEPSGMKERTRMID